MDKRKLERLSRPVVDVYLGIEEMLLVNIAKRLARHDSLLDEDIQSWQAQSLNEVESLSSENIEFIAKQSGRTVQTVRKSLQEAGYGSLEENEDILQEAVRKGRLNEASPIRESGALLSILETYERQALNTFNLVNTTMLDQSRQAYLDIVNRTTGQVLAGVSTPREALRQTVSEWAEMGVPALIDRSGRKWTTEGYVSMVTRSTSNNTANDMQQARFDEFGVDLIEVSSHAGARPLCAPYQGRIYSKSGNSNKFPPFSESSYGHPAGLFGVNCGHVQFPYIDGISRKTYQPYPKRENERIYENSQKQRYLERQIRYAKRESRMMEALGDNEGVEMAKRKVLDRQKNQREFIKRTGRTRRYDREQIS